MRRLNQKSGEISFTTNRHKYNDSNQFEKLHQRLKDLEAHTFEPDKELT